MPHQSGEKYCGEGGEYGQARLGRLPHQQLLVGWRWPRCQGTGHRRRLGGDPEADFIAACHEPCQRQGRNEQGCSRKEWPRGCEPRSQTEPGAQANAGMYPGGEQQSGLHRAPPGVESPELEEDVAVVAEISAIECVGDPGPEDVRQQQERHRETEQGLRCLLRRQTERPATPERPERQGEVDRGGVEQQRGDGRAGEDRVDRLQHSVCRADGHDHQRQVQQVDDDVPE